MVKLSIIILTYNSADYINSLLQSLVEKYSDKIESNEIEIIVADNESLDNTLDIASKFSKNIRIVKNGGNLGYAKGNNLAAKKAKGEYILFLNPDAKLIKGDFLDLAGVFDEKIGIVGGKIVSFRDEVEYSCGNFYNPFNVLLLALGLEEKLNSRFSPKKQRKVDFVSGGFLMIKKNLFDRLNGFDENYFMYIEDSDICYQAKKRGHLTVFSDKATIQHAGQGSSNRTFAVVNIYKGLIYFNKKNLGKASYLTTKLILQLKAYFLVLVGKIMNNKYLTETYSEALKAINK